MDLSTMFDAIAARAAETNKEVFGDYMKDGLLYCGKCYTKKQTIVEFMGESRIVSCMCKCQKDRIEQEEEERKRGERMLRIESMRQTGFPDADLKRCTFSDDDHGNEKLMNIARNYVKNFDEMMKRGKGLLLYGKVGTGKTFASACIANELISNYHPCFVTNFARLVNTIGGMFEGKQAYIDSLNKFDLLVIDDLASERDTEYMNEIVQNIIDSRYRAGLPLIITTNLTAQELKNPADIRKQRIYSRLFEMCVPVEVEGKDRRRQKLINDYAELDEMLGINCRDSTQN